MSSIRCYAQYNIFKNHIPYVEKLLEEYEMLPSIQLGGYFHFESNEVSDYSIVIIQEIYAVRETQESWFVRMTKRIVENTRNKLLFILYSDLDENILEERKKIYKTYIPNATFVYLDLKYYSKDISLLDQPIKEFITSL